MSSLIERLFAREILDSRGNPTVETTLVLQGGQRVVSMVPSGASTGVHEAHELRDGGARYGGLGVKKAVDHVNKTIHSALKGMSVLDQIRIDQTLISLDGTKEKKRLGANAILGASLAVVRAGAVASGLPLYRYLRDVGQFHERGWRMPQPFMNVINGGRHATNGISIQEFMIVPNHRLVAERIRIGVEVFHALARLLIKKKYTTGVGDEGGFAPNLSHNEAALSLLVTAIEDAGYTPGQDVSLALDVAASEFIDKGKYHFEKKKRISPQVLLETYTKWVKKYPLISIEDPFAEDDWENWQQITQKLGSEIGIVGDDLFVTNTERLKKGITLKAANTILIKPNQIGTITETCQAIQIAKMNKYEVIVSHRSGETVDTFIADLAVAANAEGLKAGSLSRGERVEKYNRLMQIAAEIG
jgi:enolase